MDKKVVKPAKPRDVAEFGAGAAGVEAGGGGGVEAGDSSNQVNIFRFHGSIYVSPFQLF